MHHRDHNHDNNPPDGSNWELLCLYCHDNEHQRQLEATQGNVTAKQPGKAATHNPFAALAGMLRSLGQEEVESIIAEQGQVEIGCDFCGEHYHFDPIDAGELFTEGVVTPPGSTRLQ